MKSGSHIWITNGVSEAFIRCGKEMPAGWVKGRNKNILKAAVDKTLNNTKWREEHLQSYYERKTLKGYRDLRRKRWEIKGDKIWLK